MKKFKKQSLIFFAFFVGILVATGTNYVLAHGGDISLIHACVRTSNGSLRVVGPNDMCNGNETTLDWNIQGVQGPPGPSGPPGPTGTPGTGSGLPLICPNCNLANITTLAGKDLTNAWLPGVQLRGANLQGTNFTSANLSGAVFIQFGIFANLQNTNFTNTNFAGFVNFSNYNLEGSNVIFTGATMNSAKFNDANISGLNFSNTSLSTANFTNTNATNTNFSNANLVNIQFNGTNLTGANLTGTQRDGVTWTNTTCPDGTNSDNNGNTCEGHF